LSIKTRLAAGGTALGLVSVFGSGMAPAHGAPGGQAIAAKHAAPSLPIAGKWLPPASPAHAVGTDPVGGRRLAAPGVIVNLRPGVPAPPAMPGASFLVADMVTGQILAAKAPHVRHLPASTLKTLTALTLIPRLNPNRMVVVRPVDVAVEGTHVPILAGTAYSVRNLLRGLLMASGNDAAYALARANASITATLAQMNATAARLGALDTVARDPSGLNRPGESSSVYDLALIGRAAMKLPAFRGYVATKRVLFPGGRSSNGKIVPAFVITNHNKLLFNYRGAIGIKNGYTIAAQQTFIGAATRAGKTYIVTEMASPNGSWRPTAALLDWAFAHGTALSPIGKLVEPRAAPSSAPTLAAGGLPPLQAAGSAPLPALPSLPPWVWVVALVGAVTVVGAFRSRRVSRKRR
jgi:D-alanyl-D-alanine carboxypeptidase (penicillin-binding protein 5/6)